ncbi:hypothetical protein ScPMuIL_013639 [Solemya velum]
MDEDTRSTPDRIETFPGTISNAVSGILDNIGMTVDYRRIRVAASIWIELAENTHFTSIYGCITGSRAEGIGCALTGSDVDVMVVFGDQIICRFCEWSPRPDKPYILLMDTNDVHPGYTKLKVLKNDVATFVSSLNSEEHNPNFVPDSDGNMLLSSAKLISDLCGKLKGVSSHGPAIQLCMPEAMIIDHDI